MVFTYFLVPLFLFFFQSKQIPVRKDEENTSSREFWMFIGSLIFFLTALFIIAKTSVPVVNKVFGTSFAPPEDVEFSYNKVIVLIGFLTGILTAITQYFRYKNTPSKIFLKKISVPTLVSALLMLILSFAIPFTFDKHGPGFLIAIYVAAFGAIYALVANSWYLFEVLKGKLINAGGSVAHAGFALMMIGMLISSSNKEVISNSMVNGITFPASTDPMTKQQDNPIENLTLIRHVPTSMGKYKVVFENDSLGHEAGRKFYNLAFTKGYGKDSGKTEFVLRPDVYMMKDNNMSSNPDIKTYLNKDIFTYISYALTDKGNEDTASFKETVLAKGDTAFYSKGFVVIDDVIANPEDLQKSDLKPDLSLRAHVTAYGNDGSKSHGKPGLMVIGEKIEHIDDTLFAQNLYLQFMGVKDKEIRLGLKESNRIIDFVTVKTYVFPWVNLVWLGLVIMGLGMVISIIHRSKLSNSVLYTTLLVCGSLLFYLFLIAAN